MKNKENNLGRQKKKIWENKKNKKIIQENKENNKIVLKDKENNLGRQRK